MNTVWDTVTLQEVLDARPSTTKSQFIAVTEDDTLNSCLDMMLKNKVLALPVMAMSHQADKEVLTCVGIIDVKDVLEFLIKELEYIEGWTCWSAVEFKALMEGVFVRSVVDLSRGDPLVMATSKSLLSSVINFFTSGVCHRCVLHLGENNFAVLSQVDVMHYLAKRITENDATLGRLLEEIPLSERLVNRASESRKVVSARMSDTVISILKKMYDEDVSAVALIDGNGKLQANFSNSDVLHFEMGMLSDLNLSAVDFLRKYASWALTPLAVQKEDGSLADAVVLFSALAIHRIWIVDSSNYETFAPIGIITLTDMFSMLTRLQT